MKINNLSGLSYNNIAKYTNNMKTEIESLDGQDNKDLSIAEDIVSLQNDISKKLEESREKTVEKQFILYELSNEEIDTKIENKALKNIKIELSILDNKKELSDEEIIKKADLEKEKQLLEQSVKIKHLEHTLKMFKEIGINIPIEIEKDIQQYHNNLTSKKLFRGSKTNIDKIDFLNSIFSNIEDRFDDIVNTEENLVRNSSATSIDQLFFQNIAPLSYNGKKLDVIQKYNANLFNEQLSTLAKNSIQFKEESSDLTISHNFGNVNKLELLLDRTNEAGRLLSNKTGKKYEGLKTNIEILEDKFGKNLTADEVKESLKSAKTPEDIRRAKVSKLNNSPKANFYKELVQAKSEENSKNRFENLKNSKTARIENLRNLINTSIPLKIKKAQDELKTVNDIDKRNAIEENILYYNAQLNENITLLKKLEDEEIEEIAEEDLEKVEDKVEEQTVDEVQEIEEEKLLLSENAGQTLDVEQGVEEANEDDILQEELEIEEEVKAKEKLLLSENAGQTLEAEIAGETKILQIPYIKSNQPSLLKIENQQLTQSKVLKIENQQLISKTEQSGNWNKTLVGTKQYLIAPKTTKSVMLSPTVKHVENPLWEILSKSNITINMSLKEIEELKRKIEHLKEKNNKKTTKYLK